MINYKEVLRKMPTAILYVKYEALKKDSFRLNIEFANDKAGLILNINVQEIINKDVFDIFPTFKEDIKNNNNLLKCEENLVFIRFFENLMDFIKLTIQRVNDNYFLLYFERVINKGGLKNVIDSCNMIFIKDENNRYVYGSEQFKKESNLNDSIYGLDDCDIYGDVIGGSYKESSIKFMNEKQFYSRTICRLNNKIYLLHRRGIYDNDRFVGIIANFEDLIGKIEKINDENIIAGIFNDIPDHIVYKDVNGVYLDCNNSFLKDFNIKKEDIIGKKREDITVFGEISETEKRFIETDEEVIKYGKTLVYDNELEINKKLLQYEIQKKPFFDSYGNLIGIIAVGRDNSHKKEFERLRLEFFANLSHELRTPLNLIFSSLQTIKLVEKQLLKENNRLYNYINIINQNAKRLLKLVNNLIDSTKIGCGYYEYNPKNEDIVRFVENIAMSVAEFAKQNKITLTFDTNVEEKIMAFDLEKLERTILNLLSNSIKYNKDEGKIEVLLNDCGKTFEITVKDTGIGIPSDKLEVVFERFKQVEDRLRKRSEGSGIGLSLVKDLVRIQGGTIDLKSEVGVGSEFTIKLPVSILENDNEFVKYYYKDRTQEVVTRMNIEFSDIYI